MLVGILALDVNVAMLLALALLLIQIYLSPKSGNTRLIAPASNIEILSRMLFALLLVLGITHFSVVLGPTYSGVFAAFPIAGSTIALFSHRNYSAAHAITSLKSMKRGLISMLAFFYILAVFSDASGFSIAVLIVIFVAVILQFIMLLLPVYKEKLNGLRIQNKF
ncbi:MAG: hypothetical protein B0W54_01255 [Cellvibrio sp. 79]|nr:MAG: hypothetical protein B0W54_01255 [Cellvibrio sp. 79]